MFNRKCGVAPVEGNTRKFGFINWLDGNSEQLWPIVSPLLAHCQPTVRQLSVDSPPTDGRQYRLGTVLNFYWLDNANWSLYRVSKLNQSFWA